MKSTQLINSLTIKEKIEFKNVIKSKANKDLLKLFQLLSKPKNKKTRSNKQELFLSVFGASYQPSKDYLLRNELRLLNKQLEHFLARKKLDSREERYLFIQSLQDRGLTDLFEKEVKKEIKKSVARDDFENLAKLSNLKLQQNIKSRALSEENIIRDISLCNEIDLYQTKARLYKKGELETIKAYLIKNIRNIGIETAFEVENDIPPKFDDEYLVYLKCKARGFVLDGVKKRQNLIKALQLLDQINYYDLDKDKAKVSTLNNLALEYLITHDYQNAVAAFEQLIATENLSNPIHPFVLFNYLTCLLKSGEYDKAITLINTHFSGEIDLPVLSGKLSSIKAMAWIYAGNLEKAFNELPQNLKEGSRADYFYSRLVLTIIYYLENNQDLAYREVENILQLNRDDPQSTELVFCVKSFKKFLATEHKPKKRKTLSESVDTFINTHSHGSDVLPLLWLRDRLQ